MNSVYLSKVLCELYSSAASLSFGEGDEYCVNRVFDGAVLQRLNHGNSYSLEAFENPHAWLKNVVEVNSLSIPEVDFAGLLELIAPHIRLAKDMVLRQKQLSVMCENLLDLLRHTQYGALITTDVGRVVFANAIAEQVLAKREVLEVRAKELHALKLLQQTALRKLIEITGRGDVNGDRVGGSLALKNDANGRTFAVHLLPIGGEDHSELHSASVLILIVDPDLDPLPQEETMRQLYGLTKTEASVAVRVTRGEGLKAVAQSLCVSLSTVRIHLQQVFEKTGTHRQAELVRQLMVVQAGVKVPVAS